MLRTFSFLTRAIYELLQDQSTGFNKEYSELMNYVPESFNF